MHDPQLRGNDHGQLTGKNPDNQEAGWSKMSGMQRHTWLGLILAACGSTPNTGVCHENQCLSPEAPYCDVDGVVGGTPGKCISVDCTAGDFVACSGQAALVCNSTGTAFDRVECLVGCDTNQSGCLPFCSPGSIVDCVDDQLMACNEAGTGTTSQVCGLGCATTKACRSFQPSNGLGPAFVDSALQPAAVVPLGSVINTTTGTIVDASGTVLPIKSQRVDQNNAPSIAVFEAHSFVINDAIVIGTNSVAFVAGTDIEVRGRLTARASGRTDAPGASTAAACRGGDAVQYTCMCSNACSTGAGGAGNAVAGGQGGAAGVNGGASKADVSPLAGGCRGGYQFAPDSISVVARGGGGGGAVQLVAARSVTLKDQGLIDVGGGGGESTTGGGSGGVVIIESPSVSIIGPGAGIVANGGAGGGCGMTGPDATPNGSQALGAVCPNYFSGSGGTGTANPGKGCVIGVDNCTGNCQIIYGGGGGSVGRARIVSKDGGYAVSGSPVLSVSLNSATLSPL